MASVVILMGSNSDEEKVAPCAEILGRLGIDFYLTVTSAHRTPERTARIVAEQEKAGAKVFICAAGMAAHLAGAVAAKTVRPVIGIPISGTAFGGMDALLSTVQMPTGIPVAAVGVNGGGNAALLAAQILAVEDASLAQRLADKRAADARKVLDKDASISDRLA